MITIPTDQPWVPLRILSLGLDKSAVVDADVFVLTDDQPQLLAGRKGLALEQSGPAPARLLTDLRGDKGMEWVPASMWFSYLRVQADAGDLRYDLAMSTQTRVAPTLQDVGLRRSETARLGAVEAGDSHGGSWPWPAAGTVVGAGILAVVLLGGVLVRRGPSKAAS